ncbi:MAG: NUDIX domain-containing protein [archaeon]
MDAPKPAGDEKVVYSGRIFEVVRQPMNVGGKMVEFEIVRRSPGVRLLIVKESKMLLVREYRSELRGFDFRLPGGKVFDSLAEYKRALDAGVDVMGYARDAAKKECLEETGLIAKRVEHIHTTASGATVVWDLFYFVVDDFCESKSGSQPEDGEVIHPEWKTFDEVRKMCLDKEVKEDRSVAVIFRFLSER